MVRRTFWGAMALSGAVVAVAAALLPERVPLHFGPGPGADRYGSRTEFLVATGGTAAGVAVLFPALVLLVRRIPLRYVDVPHARYWGAGPHRAELCRRLADDVWFLGAATALLLAGVCALATSAAVTGAGRLSGWTVVLLLAYALTLAGRVGRLVTRRYRPPDGG